MRSLLVVMLIAALSSAVEAEERPAYAELKGQGHVSDDQILGILKDDEEETMMGAVRKDDPEMIQRVLNRASEAQNQADIHLRGGDNKTLLMYAAIWGGKGQGKEKVVPMLIELGVPLNAVDEQGHTAVMYAASLAKPGVMRLLLVR